MSRLRALRILPIMPDQQCIRAKGKERGKVTIWFYSFEMTPLNCFFGLRLLIMNAILFKNHDRLWGTKNS